MNYYRHRLYLLLALLLIPGASLIQAAEQKPTAPDWKQKLAGLCRCLGKQKLNATPQPAAMKLKPTKALATKKRKKVDPYLTDFLARDLWVVVLQYMGEPQFTLKTEIYDSTTHTMFQDQIRSLKFRSYMNEQIKCAENPDGTCDELIAISSLYSRFHGQTEKYLSYFWRLVDGRPVFYSRDYYIPRSTLVPLNYVGPVIAHSETTEDGSQYHAEVVDYKTIGGGSTISLTMSNKARAEIMKQLQKRLAITDAELSGSVIAEEENEEYKAR